MTVNKTDLNLYRVTFYRDDLEKEHPLRKQQMYLVEECHQDVRYRAERIVSCMYGYTIKCGEFDKMKSSIHVEFVSHYDNGGLVKLARYHDVA